MADRKKSGSGIHEPWLISGADQTDRIGSQPCFGLVLFGIILRSFKIKICGVTNAADANHAVNAGADAIGFNFYERSLRSVTPLDALEIVAGLPDDPIVVGPKSKSEILRALSDQ